MRKRTSYGRLAMALAAAVCVLAGTASARNLAAPTITGVAPASGQTGQKVTIYGHDLAQPLTLQFSGHMIPSNGFTVTSDGLKIVTSVPADIAKGPGQIVITTSGGTVSHAFTVTSSSTVGHANTTAPRPSITNLKPLSGAAGTKVTITGHNLNGAMWITFGGTKAQDWTIPSSSRVVVRVPKGAVSGKVTLHTWLGNGTSSMRFTVRAL